jgi:hypothetical protein
MSEQEIKDLVWEVAREASARGPGWAQEGVVLRAVRDRITERGGGRPEVPLQQRILHAWHDLFAEKKLAWGYDLDNPGSPFFHVRVATLCRPRTPAFRPT